MLEFIFEPNEEDHYRYTFPAATAELDGKIVDAIPGFRENLEKFARILAEQLGCPGIQLHRIDFTQVLNPRKISVAAEFSRGKNEESQRMVDDYLVEDSDLDGELEYCGICGAELVGGYPETGGCPDCLPCGGQYSPGTEECDFCEWSDECGRLEPAYHSSSRSA